MELYMNHCLLLTIIIGLGCSSGCTTALPKLAKELKHDNATVVHRVRTIYGTSDFIRSNPNTNQSVVINPDGTVTIQAK